mmetsp:Transcript_10994/g.37423  ORF Transcript_10994/g.37423 Transcript_10994/m.37423 type:complete len:327 (-) Transcript_10994:877-1857(-)
MAMVSVHLKSMGMRHSGCASPASRPCHSAGEGPLVSEGSSAPAGAACPKQLAIRNDRSRRGPSLPSKASTTCEVTPAHRSKLVAASASHTAKDWAKPASSAAPVRCRRCSVRALAGEQVSGEGRKNRGGAPSPAPPTYPAASMAMLPPSKATVRPRRRGNASTAVATKSGDTDAETRTVSTSRPAHGRGPLGEGAGTDSHGMPKNAELGVEGAQLSAACVQATSSSRIARADGRALGPTAPATDGEDSRGQLATGATSGGPSRCGLAAKEPTVCTTDKSSCQGRCSDSGPLRASACSPPDGDEPRSREPYMTPQGASRRTRSRLPQ